MNELLTALAALILQAQVDGTSPGVISPRNVTTHVNGTVGLLAFDKKEFKGTSVRGKHAAIALSGFGDVVGVILNKRGTALCEFVGYFDGECVVLQGCGASGVSC